MKMAQFNQELQGLLRGKDKVTLSNNYNLEYWGNVIDKVKKSLPAVICSFCGKYISCLYLKKKDTDANNDNLLRNNVTALEADCLTNKAGPST